MAYTYTFSKLIKDYNIEIPLLQRDYAQGRTDTKTNDIREKFVADLFSTLNENKQLDLDFIYGPVEKGTFVPLDGQQRLTTLFLLHLYLYAKNNPSGENKIDFTRFKYKVRVTTQEFIDALIANAVAVFKSNTPSFAIKDAHWYYATWNSDPSIKGMLEMLDAIAAVYKGFPQGQKPPELADLRHITFKLIPMNDYSLGDDLYMRMNARGLVLTPFEIFKAGIEEKGWDTNREPNEKFSAKADKEWANFFWQHTKPSADLTKVSLDRTGKFDNVIMRFIANSLLCSLALEADDEGKQKIIKELQENPALVSPKHVTAKSFKTLYIDLNNVSDNKFIPPAGVEFWDNEPKLEVYLGEKITWKQLVLFFAQTRYFEKNESADVVKYADWMRVVRNIVQNSTIDSETFVGAVKLIEELSKGCDDIYTFLKDQKIESTFAKEQVTEEIRKATLISKRTDFKLPILDAENLPFCKGRISCFICP